MCDALGVNQRCYGKYTCNLCNNRWSSVHAWRFYYQICQKCEYGNKVIVDEKSLKPLKRDETGGQTDRLHRRREHLSAFCEKCQEIHPQHYICTYFKHTTVNPSPRPFPADLGKHKPGQTYADSVRLQP